MDQRARDEAIRNYRALYRRHRKGASVAQASIEGQTFRFEKLVQIADLTGASVLDVGCGIGDLYPYLIRRFGAVDYLGVDIVPELVQEAAATHRDARFVCRDILAEPLDASFDWVLMSMMFNNALPHDADAFLRQMVTEAFRLSRKGLAFNFISTYVNFRDGGLEYHDPVAVLDFCLRALTTRVAMYHHYERCDVAIFLYK